MSDAPRAAAPDVWRITTPLPFRPREVHAYLLRDADGGWALVDGGIDTDEAWEALRTGVERVAGSIGAIGVHVVTHMHLDHVGLARRVREASGARLVMSRLDAERAAHARAYPEEEADYRARFLRENGAPDAVRAGVEEIRARADGLAPHVPADVVVVGDDGPLPGVPGWRYVWTSGHTAGHLSLHRPSDGIVVAGDAVLPRITPTIGVNRQRLDPVGDYLAALDRLEALAPAALLPGHGDPLPDPLGRIRELREETRCEGDRVLGCLGDEPLPAWEAAVRRHPAPDLPVAIRMLALREVRAHLDHLAAAGRVARDRTGGGVWVFARRLGGAAGQEGGGMARRPTP